MKHETNGDEKYASLSRSFDNSGNPLDKGHANDSFRDKLVRTLEGLGGRSILHFFVRQSERKGFKPSL